MGYFHTNSPENGLNKKRHICLKCKRNRMEIFMIRINSWHQGQWQCRQCYFKRIK